MTPNPYVIFASAQRYWQAAAYPRYVSYGVGIRVSRGGVISTAHYHAWYDAAENRVTVNATSDEELAHPYTPHGINFSLSLFGGSVPLSAPQHTFDYLGVPVLAPNYSFGIVDDGPANTERGGMRLVRQIRREFHDPAPIRNAAASASSLKTIAEIAVAHRRYIITYEGTQPLDGHVDYRLRLRPVADPATYRLRKMWVNASTYATDRLLTAGDFTAAQLAAVRWQVDYVQIGGAPFISSEIALEGFTLDRRHYDGASVAFTDVIAAAADAPLSRMPRFETDSGTAPPTLAEPLEPRM